MKRTKYGKPVFAEDYTGPWPEPGPLIGFSGDRVIVFPVVGEEEVEEPKDKPSTDEGK